MPTAIRIGEVTPDGSLSSIPNTGNRLVDDFDSDYAVQVCIPGTVDRALPTLAYPFQDFVSSDSLEHSCREL